MLPALVEPVDRQSTAEVLAIPLPQRSEGRFWGRRFVETDGLMRLVM